MYVRSTICAGSRLLIEKLCVLLNPLVIIRTVDSRKFHGYKQALTWYKLLSGRLHKTKIMVVSSIGGRASVAYATLVHLHNIKLEVFREDIPRAV